jgi:hypothetical protein
VEVEFAIPRNFQSSGPLVLKQKIYREDGGKITMKDIQIILPSKLHGSDWEQDGNNEWYRGVIRAWLLSSGKELIFTARRK